MNGIDILVDTTIQRRDDPTTQCRSQKTLKTSVVKGKQVGKKYNPYIKVVICNIWPKIMNSYRDQFGNLAIELDGSKVIKHFGILHKTCQVPRTWLLGLTFFRRSVLLYFYLVTPCSMVSCNALS